MTITNFLAQRLDELESVAQQLLVDASSACDSCDRAATCPHGSRWDSAGWEHNATSTPYDIFVRATSPESVLADIAAKRRIISEFVDADAAATAPDYDGGYASGLERAVRLFAEPFATHPDYNDAQDPNPIIGVYYKSPVWPGGVRRNVRVPVDATESQVVEVVAFIDGTAECDVQLIDTWTPVNRVGR